MALRTLAALFAAVLLSSPGAAQPSPAPEEPSDEAGLAFAKTAFYNGRYDEASAHASALIGLRPDHLDALELRTSAVLFRLKYELGDAKNKDRAFRSCVPCPALLSGFLDDTRRAQALARARVKADAWDEDARFLLGKIDLNYIWLHLGPLGRRAGWDEYFEAKRSLDAVLDRHPGHVRARVARAWMDYIVDTRVPWGTKWIFGGGSRTQALAVVREAALADADAFVSAEARFALWEMELREKNLPEAVDAAERLLREFPENRDLAAFVAARR